MKLTWHILLKDLRRWWPALLLWGITFAGYLFAEARLDHAVKIDGEIFVRLRFFKILFFVIQLLVSYLFTAGLVLEDAAVGSTTFWSTRPIAGTRLLGAKTLLSIFSFVVVPLLIAEIWWRADGVESQKLTERVVTLFGYQIRAVWVAIVLAAFSGSLGKFVGWTLGVTFGTVAAVASIQPDRDELPAASFVVLIAMSLGAVFVLYQFRRRRLALLLLSGGVIGAFALAFV
jgi:hypothetical protein